MAPEKKPLCFVIAPIGPDGSDTRKRSDQVLKHLFKKALEGEYRVVRADEIDEPGMITSQILRSVQEADLVVADLTEQNPNVFYELAVRHAIEKPIIHVIETRLSKIPFDVGGFRTIEFNLTDPDSLEGAVQKLKKFAQQAQQGNWGDTPIKLANIMGSATRGDSPQLVLLRQAVEGIANVSARVTAIEASLRPTTFGIVEGQHRLVALSDLLGSTKATVNSPAVRGGYLDYFTTKPGQPIYYGASLPEGAETKDDKQHKTLGEPPAGQEPKKKK